jgi:ribA/ribD-fused uncharacterized protein
MTEKFTFFWSGPFSQWRLSPFTLGGIKYNTAEQFMMAEKAKLFGDHEIRAKIMETEMPDAQKALGRAVRNFDLDLWKVNAKEIVYRGSHAKFTQNSKLYINLLETKGTTIVEASPYDVVWGIGLAESHPHIQDKSHWRGTNWLGEVLTTLRVDLIGE